MNFLSTEYSQRKASLIVVLASSIWGLLWLPMRHVAGFGIAEFWVNFLFMILPAIVLGAFAGRSVLVNRDHWPVYLSAGFCMGSGFALYSMGLLLSSVNKTTVLFYLVPVWATLLSQVFLHERPTMRRWLAVAGAIIGCVLVMQIWRVSLSFNPLDLFGLVSGILWAIGTVILRRFPSANYVNLTFSQYVMGSLLCIVCIIWLDIPVPPLDAALKAVPIAFVVAACIFMPSVLAIFRISQYLAPGVVCILMLSEVVLAVASAALILGERLSSSQWVGVIIIICTGLLIGLAEDAENATD